MGPDTREDKIRRGVMAPDEFATTVSPASKGGAFSDDPRWLPALKFRTPTTPLLHNSCSFCSERPVVGLVRRFLSEHSAENWRPLVLLQTNHAAAPTSLCCSTKDAVFPAGHINGSAVVYGSPTVQPPYLQLFTPSNPPAQKR